MKKQTIIEGWINLVSRGYYTHALTLKPNSMKVAAAGPVSRITSGNEKFQLTTHSGSIQRSPNIPDCNFNDKVLFERLYRFHGLFDGDLIGRRFYEEKNKHLRTQMIAVAEGNNDTGHLHCAIRVHETRLTKFNEMFPADLTNAKGKQLWNKVSVGGTVVVKEIKTADDWAEYIAKSLFGHDFSDRIRFLP